jgi:hypothetical protein
MKSKSILTCIAILLSGLINAQTPADTSWKNGGFIGVNFTQINLSKWSPGGENSLSLSAGINLFANYAKDKTEWANSLDLGYALLKSGTESIRKNDDKIELNSKYGHKFSEHWLYGALVNFKSQFANGYNYPNDSFVISKFLAPGYITVALGVTYKPVEYFEVFISPATGKYTLVTDKTLSDLGAYGVDPGKTVRAEFGAYLNMKFKKDIMENITLASKLELFNNYTDKDKDNAKKIDVNWETSINMKINNYFTATFNTQVVYDANVVETTQFKEIFGVGFGYKF